MHKVNLNFRLAGKTDGWKKIMSYNSAIDWSNAVILDFVKAIISEQFGDRALVVVDESKILNSIGYPDFFSAGWFTSASHPMSELVLVAHGDNMAAAGKSMLDSVRDVDWDSVSVRV